MVRIVLKIAFLKLRYPKGLTGRVPLCPIMALAHVESARIEASDQLPHPLRVVIKFPPSRAGKGVKYPGYARGVNVEASI